MSFKEYISEVAKYYDEWFHGTGHDIKRFSDDFVGQGDDQEGPGIYFSSSESEAYDYASRRATDGGRGTVYKVQLEFNKIVPLHGKLPAKELKQLIGWAPNLETTLTDWDENPKIALRDATASVMRQKDPLAAFQTICSDFYRNDPVEFVRNMVILGYDGVIVPKSFGGEHAIVYNPKIIKLLDKF